MSVKNVARKLRQKGVLVPVLRSEEDIRRDHIHPWHKRPGIKL